MTYIRPDLDSNEDDKHTYPTVVNGRIVEMTGSQRRRLKERSMTLEERVNRLERAMYKLGINLIDI